MDDTENQFLRRVRQIHQALNIPETFATDRKLPLQREATELVEVTPHSDHRKKHRLTPSTANAWANMVDAARQDHITLILVSGFRGLEYQRNLIENKLQKGQKILDILTLLAPPGYSEHHTGTAIDLTTTNCPPCVEHFENTEAFAWLQKNAGKFGFSLSYPRDNPYGFVYEPWHWAFRNT